jgi:hypothetical protein
LGALKQNWCDIGEDQRPHPAIEFEHCHCGILDPGRPLKPIGLSLDVAHHPATVLVAQQIAEHVCLVRRIVG